MPDSRRPAAMRPGVSHAGISALRARLGLPPTASSQEVINAAAAALQDESHREVEALRARMGLAAGATDQQVIDAAAGRLAARQAPMAASQSPTRGATPGAVLDWATKTGRISACSRTMWERNWIADPVKTVAILRILAPVPSAAVPVAAATAQGRTEAAVAHTRPEVAALPARIQRAAARQSDPAMLARWSQRYAGMSDAEVSPDALMMDGEEWLFREVRRDEDEARGLALDAHRRQFEANVQAHHLQTVANADFVRDHGGYDRGLLAGGILRRPPQTPA